MASYPSALRIRRPPIFLMSPIMRHQENRRHQPWKFSIFCYFYESRQEDDFWINKKRFFLSKNQLINPTSPFRVSGEKNSLYTLKGMVEFLNWFLSKKKGLFQTKMSTKKWNFSYFSTLAPLRRGKIGDIPWKSGFEFVVKCRTPEVR